MNSRPPPYQGGALPLSYLGGLSRSLPCALPGVLRGAGDRARTGDIQLGRLTLYQLSYSRRFCCPSPSPCLVSLPRWWRVVDLNHCRLTPADLQSAPFDRSGNPPKSLSFRAESDANCVLHPASWRGDSNLQPPVYKTGALPIELRQRWLPSLHLRAEPMLNAHVRLAIEPNGRTCTLLGRRAGGRYLYARQWELSSKKSAEMRRRGRSSHCE